MKWPWRYREQYIAQTLEPARVSAAKRGGYLPPPREEDCPARPNWCQYCLKDMNPAKLLLDHNHNVETFPGSGIGRFCAWCCASCNVRNTDAMDDFGVMPCRRRA